MAIETVSLGQILKNITDYDWNKSIYCTTSEYSVNTQCKVLTMDEALNNVENQNMHHALTVSQAQDVMANLAQQMQGPTEKDLLEAFMYYIQNDSYIVK